MSTIKGEVKGDVLVLTIDISDAARKASGPSKSALQAHADKGKPITSHLLASTGGFTRFGDIQVSMNVMCPIK